MKTKLNSFLRVIIFCFLITSCTWAQQQDKPCGATGNEYYSGVEINNILCGYSFDRECLIYDYSDAGHIQLGEKTNFKPKEMEILEYRLGDSDTTVRENTMP